MMKSDTPSPYGHCPVCGGLGRSRERRPDGDDRCENGHVYPSSKAVKNTLTPVVSEKLDLETSEELQLRNLLEELVNLFGWGDKTPLHAVLHVRNAVDNMQTDSRLSERDAIVAWLRERANDSTTAHLGLPILSPAGRGLLLLMADRIERGDHRGGKE